MVAGAPAEVRSSAVLTTMVELEVGGGVTVNLPDESLILRCRDGDPSALETIFRRHERMLRAKARRLLPRSVRGKVSVSDVLQDARIAAHEHCRDFEPRGQGTVRAWLARIVERKALETARRYEGTAKRDAGREADGCARPSTGQFMGHGPSPSEAAIGAEVTAAVLRAMEHLPDDQRTVLRLAKHDGLSFAEIAICMGRSPEAVRKLHARALLRFTERLAAETGESRGGR